MLFCEIYLPHGAHSRDQLRVLADELTLIRLAENYASTHDVDDTTADPGVMVLLGSLNHVIIHEIGSWTVGGVPVDATSPRYLARIYVPGPWRKDLSGFLIGSVSAAITTALGKSDSPAGPRIEVQVLPVPEGSYGLDGRVIGESDLLEMVSSAKTGRATTPDALVDPVCGMVATDPELTLDHDGVTYGFCSAGCRKYFQRTHATGAAK